MTHKSASSKESYRSGEDHISDIIDYLEKLQTKDETKKLMIRKLSKLKSQQSTPKVN